MSENSLALLVCGDEETFGALRKTLQSLGIPTLRANTCEDARRELREASLPKLVFTSTELPDGNWEKRCPRAHLKLMNGVSSSFNSLPFEILPGLHGWLYSRLVRIGPVAPPELLREQCRYSP